MSEESPEEEQKDNEPDTLDKRLLTKLRNIPVIARIIVLVAIVGASLASVNKIHEEWETMMSWLGPPKPPDPAFSVEVLTIVNGEAPFFWITKREDKSAVCATPLALTIAITNLQPHPAKIDYYEVEALNVNDKWVKVPRIPNQSSDQKVYAGLDPGNLTIITGPFLDRLAVSTLFESHVPVSGWAFFDLPFPGSVAVFKVTVRDTEGHQFTSEPLTPPVQSLQAYDMGVGEHNYYLDHTKHQFSYHCGL
jgi:hypothetical protein